MIRKEVIEMSEIRDLSLWESGARKIEWVRRNMNILNSVREEFERDKPFAGLDDKCTEIVAHMIEKHIQSGKTVILV